MIEDEGPPTALIELIMALRARGIRNRRVLAALEKTPRHLFVDDSYAAEVYADQALPIACGQTISQPYIVALMTEALEVSDRHTVLEIGTGSGYQTAILSRLARRVTTIERYKTLSEAAEARFEALKLSNISTIVADGMAGWPPQAPFDRIIVTAAAPDLPQTLYDQLSEGGIMVVPVGPADDVQTLLKVRETPQGPVTETLVPVRFVPIVAGKAREL